MAGSMVPEWFQPDVYYQNKLSGGDAAALNAALLAAGYSLDAHGLYRHFIEYGNSEGVSPNVLFDAQDYLRNKTADFFGAENPTNGQIAEVASIIAAAGMTAWDHYCQYGWIEGINPSDAFDAHQYFSSKLVQLGSGWTWDAMIQAFVDSSLNPVAHYYTHGIGEGLSVKPVALTVPEWFEWEVYYQNKLAAMAAGWTPAVLDKAFENNGYSVDAQGMYRHFVDCGNNEGVSPNAFFDTQDYLKNKTADFFGVKNPTATQMADVAARMDNAGMTLWEHYCRYGWEEGINPSDTFDGSQYIETAAAYYNITVEQMIQKLQSEGINPVTHSLMHDIGWTPPDPTTNTPPVITGIPTQTMQLSAGGTIHLMGLSVSDADRDELTVTLTTVNGTLGGVTDVDPDTPGIQLKGSAPTINATLKNLTFAANDVGSASITVTADDGKKTTTAICSFSATVPVVDNAAPVIDGVPDVLQRISFGTETALANFTVSDAENNNLIVTLVAEKGELSGVKDADLFTDGIQLSGTFSDINAELAKLKFKATERGNASIFITVEDVHGGSNADTYNLFTPYDATLDLGNGEFARIIGAEDFAYAFTQPLRGWWTDMLSFIDPAIVDAEKVGNENYSHNKDSDDNMCWAAAASNLLVWSGWAQQSSLKIAEGYTAEDDVFDVFRDNFTLGATHSGNTRYGMEWFFDGIYDMVGKENENNGWNQPVENSGNYVGLNHSDFVYRYSIQGIKSKSVFTTLSAMLDAGCALGLSIGKYDSVAAMSNSDNRGGGHALTCWGYTYDKAKTSDQNGYLTGLIISDSDDGMQPSVRAADDRIKILGVEWDPASNAYYSEDYGSVRKLETLYWVLPNSTCYVGNQISGVVGITGSTTPVDFFEDIAG